MLKKTSKPKSMPKGKISKIRKKPGESNAYKYTGAKKYAGPEHTYPIPDLAHARNALARAHFAKSPGKIKEKVYKSFPGLKKRHAERSKEKE